MKNKIKELIKITKEVKFQAFTMLNNKGGGHYEGSFSCAEIIVNIFFNQKKKNDHFILSKAHAGVILYSVLAKKNLISKKLLETYGAENCKLGVHGEHDLLKAIEFSSGSLGHGLSYANGLALAVNKKNIKKNIFVILGDGECQEGSIWEAAMFASHHKLKNLIVYLDLNQKQSSGKTSSILNIEPISKKWRSFGWNTVVVDGHSHKNLSHAFKKIKRTRPNIIIAKTVKGNGVSFFENKSSCHYDRLNKDQIEKAEMELNV